MYFGYILASLHPFWVYKSCWWVGDFISISIPVPFIIHTRNPPVLPQPIPFPNDPEFEDLQLYNESLYNIVISMLTFERNYMYTI